MSLGTFARLSFSVLALLLPASRASAQLFVETTEIEGSQQRLDFANVATGPFTGTLPLPAPPPLIAFDASHEGNWFLDYGIGCASASTIWGNQSGSENGATGVNVAWDDSFVITAPGRSGIGFVDVRLGFGGQLSADESASRSSYGGELSLVGEGSEDQGFFFRDWFGECFGSNVCTGGDVVGDPLGSYPMPGEDPLRVLFTFGQPIFLDIRLDARGEAAQSERGQATAAPTLRWLGIAQVFEASCDPMDMPPCTAGAAVASYSVASDSGFDYSQAAAQCGGGGSSVHDLALGSVKAPKKVALAKSAVQTNTKVTIQNRGTHDETIPDAGTLAVLVDVTVESLGGCAVPVGMLLPPKKGFPAVLRPNGKLALTLLLSIECANDPAASSRDEDHSDYRVSMDVDHSVLGAPDGVPANDHCPRAPSGSDKGCGSKTGGDILIDVIVK